MLSDMINFPDSGYSPKNFEALVEATGLRNTEFIEAFKLSKASFYFYKKGDVTMQHKDWVKLTQKVEASLVKETDK